MGRFSRQEIEEAFAHFTTITSETKKSNLPGKPWYDRFADLYTEDAIYIEHVVGVMRGREAIRKWISEAMTAPERGLYWDRFPSIYHMIDEEKGWLMCYFQNRLEDAGDGLIYQEPNPSILHYAGNGQWSYQEDVYNPAWMVYAFDRWKAAKAGKPLDTSHPQYQRMIDRAEAHAEADRRTGHNTIHLESTADTLGYVK